MRKIISLILAAAYVFAGVQATAQTVFEITADGEITSYNGDGDVVIPTEINGITVKKIGENTFAGSPITSVDIPATVHTVENSSFANCSQLSVVYIRTEDGKISLSADCFGNTPYISLYLYCVANNDTMHKNFALAKGDDNYNIITTHKKMTEETIKLGNSDVGCAKCEDCGYLKMKSVTAGGHPFLDVSDSAWYGEYVDIAYNTGIINGKADGKFDPDATMTCGEAAKIAASMHALIYNNPISTAKSDTDEWYVPFTNYCYENGIFGSHINIKWNKPITRAQMAYVFAHAETSYDYINEVIEEDIPDVHAATPYGYEILELYEKGIAVGDETISFHPGENIKRSEVAAIISRILFSDMRIKLSK